MPKLYIANCSPQVVQFSYRLPETTRNYMQSVPIASQICISGRDIPPQVVDDIIERNQKYGIVSVAEALRGAHFYGLAYSVDKPATYA